MKYLNLETLTTEETKEYIPYKSTVLIRSTREITALKREMDKVIDVDDVRNSERPIKYMIDIEAEDEITPDEFLSFVNIALASFFEKMITKKDRERGRRLDVPANLKEKCHMSMALLKRAINAQTINDKFNVIVRCNEYSYKMVD